MEYTTYLFDFDYTLADSSRGIVICFRNVLERHGHTGITDEAIKRTIGKTLEQSFTILTGINNADTLAAYKKEYIKEADTHMNVNTFLFPETVEVLHALKDKGARIGVVSTKFRYRLKAVLDQYFPADFFDIIIGGEDVKTMKPDPQGIGMALRKLGRNRGETLYIGDSTVDAETARNARVDFVGVLNGMTTREELSQYPHRKILDDLSLLPLVQRPSAYRRSPLLPRKAEALWRMVQVKLIRGKGNPAKALPQNHTCRNCGNVFIGNYCPNCGQTEDTPRFTLRNAFQNILSGFFNIDNGFTRNLLEFLCRPGYMIRNYLDGHRVHYFKPFQTLFVLAALYIMAVQLIDPKAMQNLEEDNAEYTYETLQKNIRALKKDADDKSVLTLLDQSRHYADSARILVESTARDDQSTGYTQQTMIEMGLLLAPKVEAAGKHPDVNAILTELADSLAHADSLKLLTADEAESKLIRQKAGERKAVLRFFRKHQGHIDFTHLVNENAINVSDGWNHFKQNYLNEDGFLMAVFNLMKSWVHGNKAFSILALLPIFTFGIKRGFRRTPVGRRLNTTEVFFAQVYIACQILWLSILVLPFTRTAHLDDVFDLNYTVIFLLFVWDLRQLYGTTWLYSLKRTIVSFCYCLLLLIVVSVLIVLLLLGFAWIVTGGNLPLTD